MFNFKCNVCENNFETRSTLMKHKKVSHPDRMSKCKRFKQGNCNEDEKSCWFIHPSVVGGNDSIEMEEESGFQEAQEKSPPDQMTNVLNMINRLSFQVEQLEKISRKKTENL